MIIDPNPTPQHSSRRRIIQKILAGTPVIFALSARSAYASNGSGYASNGNETHRRGENTPTLGGGRSEPTGFRSRVQKREPRNGLLKGFEEED